MKKYKILLVDDDPVLIKGTTLYLEQKGYHVFTADNGKAAIELLQASSFDLVLTDLVMPEIDGFKVLKKAKNLHSEIMVLIMTGFGDVKFAIDCLRLGADDYILKPCEPEEMLFRIKNCLEKLETKKRVEKSEKALKYTKLQLEAVFDNLDSSIYISDMKSYEILFMNHHMKELFGKDLTGNICWKSIHENMNGPCKFCTNSKFTDADGNYTKPYIWEFYNQKLKKWYELHDMMVPWLDGKLVRMEIATDITDRKQIEQKQNKINEMLENKVKERTADLEDMNTALKVLLNKREKDKKEIEEKLFANYKLLILPFIDQLRNSLTQKNQEDLINILASELKDIISPFSKKLSDPLVNLTPTEIKVASLIKLEKSNKEIAEILNSSIHTISHHRENIRKKTGLKNKKINLKSYLSTLY